MTNSATQTHEQPWKLDVYAHSFIPRSLLAINDSPSHLISLAPAIGLDFDQYISDYACKTFLRVIEFSLFDTYNDKVSNVNPALDQLDARNYGPFFGKSLLLENQSQIPEVRSYDLFAIILEPLDFVNRIYTLRVHGIREGTPSLNVGDSLCLRQLIIDPITRLPHGTEAWLTSGGSERGEIAPGFTGYQISATIIAIDKANELAILNATGIGAGLPLVCNVMFELQHRVMESLQRAVADVANELCSGRRMASSHASSLQISLTSSLQVHGTTVPCSNDWLHHMLFPSNGYGVWQYTISSAVFNQKLYDNALNFEQQKAVNAVHSKNYGNLCYIISGPPGSGKTKTVCEMAVQLGKDPSLSGSILLCCPSNPAADTLAQRLRRHFEPGTLLRLNEFSRTFAEVPQELLPYCWVEQDMFSIPPFRKFMAYKIVIMTCQGADALVQARLTNRDIIALQINTDKALGIGAGLERKPATLHWSALVIDEAAQAMEPEALIPLTVITPPLDHPCLVNPIFVMVGDEHQLSARTSSKDAPLHVSLFERLAHTPVYAKHPLARKNAYRGEQKFPMIRPPFVNLMRNYRSHPAILALPSSLFYYNTLVPEATNTDSLHAWTGWRGRRWPVLFASNGGIDECEDVRTVGGGWFNTQEAREATRIAQQFLIEGLISDESEICIMSPFKAQVRLIRRFAKNAGLWRINIGPVEAFQGLESRVVIICTTRARKRFLENDRLKGVGLVNQRKKFNVALTRAKEGLVVIGNPWILATDPYWLAFLRFCQRNTLWQDDLTSSRPIFQFEEANVNNWRSSNPHDSDYEASGLEAALIYKERDKTKGSQAVKRFMSGSETLEEAMWRIGLEAEISIQDQDDERS